METAASSTQPQQRPDVRVYLEEKVFPILTTGLDELLTAVEEREKKIKEGEEVPEINPSFFLARYLMRCAQQKSHSTSTEESAAISTHRSEKSDDEHKEEQPADENAPEEDAK